MEKVKWRWDMGCYIPFCPYCGEPAYEKDKCSFCGREYEWVEGKHQPTKVTVGEYTIIQTTGKSIYLIKGEKVIAHMSCSKKMSEDELRRLFDRYD
jgi:hypothetical protein